MNILHLQTELNTTCGISKTIFHLVNNSNNGNVYLILCFGGDGLKRFYSIGMKPIVCNCSYRKTTYIPILIFKILLVCKTYNIDVIHSHHRYFDLISFIISKLLKVKTVTSVHSIVYKRKRISYLAEELIACSYAVKNHLIDYFKINSDKIKVLHNFIDINEIDKINEISHLNKKLNIPKNHIVVGFVGRLNIEEKGLDILIGALNNIVSLQPDLHLLLIGNGKDEEKILKLLKNTKIKWQILEPQQDIYEYFNLFDIFVLPSRREPFGLVLLEAGLLKKTCIGSRVEGISELIEDGVNGLLVEPDNIEELADAIISLIDNPRKAQELGENLYRKVISGYTAKNIIPKYEAIYQDLIYVKKNKNF